MAPMTTNITTTAMRIYVVLIRNLLFNLGARYKHRRAILPYYNGYSPITSIARGVASIRQLGERLDLPSLAS